MIKKTNHRFFMAILAFAITIPLVCTHWVRADDILMLDTPATNWQKEAYPLGNGRLGCMIFGGVEEERIQFNVDSLWTGDANLPGDYGAPGMGHYQNFGDLYIALDAKGPVTEYKRQLNISRAVSRVSYEQDGTEFVRETFCSHPDQVIVTRMTANAEGKYSGRIKLDGGREEKTSVTSNRMTFAGTLSNGMEYEAQAIVTAQGGTLKKEGDELVFSGCNSLTITLAAGTSYVMDHATNWKGDNPHKLVTTQVEGAAKQSYEDLLKKHVKDYQSLYNRVSVDLGETEAAQRALPTSKRLAEIKNGKADPEMDALLFQYGRYLLIACSRPGTLPANLQGLWNHVNKAPWHSDYHSNINLQMNYWPAEQTNLSECHTPLFDMLTASLVPFRKATKLSYGEDIRGFTIRTSHNPFGGMGWKWNIPASAWYARHFWEHYEFGRDKEFLKTVAYPFLKEVCHYWEDHLKELPDGRLVAPDGWSPEHGPVEDGVSHDQQIIWDLFSNTIAAAKELGVDEDYRKKLSQMRDKLVGPKIGKWGQLQEWMEDRDDPKDHHRHISHIYALHPGYQISPVTTPKLADAARTTMNGRGDGGTGWSKAWKINIWARLHDGNRAHKLLTEMIRGNIYDNLFDTHPPFQIDGNFGYTSGVAEMLMQSHSGVIHLLPALPEAWATGSIKGLRARGGIEVEINWKDGKLATVTLTNNTGANCTVKYKDTKKELKIKKGEKVTLSGQLEVTAKALDGAKGKIFHVDMKNKSFRLLTETAFDPKTDEGKSWHTVYWSDKTRFTRLIHQVDFKGITGPVVTAFHPLNENSAKAIAEGKPFSTRYAEVLISSKKKTGITESDQGKRLTARFTPDPTSLRSGTIALGDKKVQASLNRRGTKVGIHSPAKAENLESGFWEATIDGKKEAGRFIAEHMVISPLVDPRTVDDPKLPRVLVVGDSISMNYHNSAKAALAGKANYYRVEGNGGPSDRGVSCMELWLGDYKQKGLHWDVIQFNHGLHDLKQPYNSEDNTWGEHQVSIEDYKKNLEKEIEIMKRTGATLIWCATTPVPNSNKGPYARRKGESQVFNKAALEVVSKYPEIQVNDLHKTISESKAFDNWRKGSDVHYWGKEQSIVGAAVADAITKALETRKSKTKAPK